MIACLAACLAVLTAAPTPPALQGTAHPPGAVVALVNKRVRLPDGWEPRRLVVPELPFTFAGFHEKRQLRPVAARAAEALFAHAAADGAPLAGVSGYRSEATQRSLFAYHVGRLGRAQARRVSARPRHSEHETGLALDVTGRDGRCPAQPCFAGTRAARWLERHAHEHGFVVRYPADGEASTGYAYEPWHLRYLGPRRARELTAAGLTYEELLGG